jgi:putative FmdB family regulatory protein
MPLYEYLCDGCGHRFEIIQKFSDAPLETCPKCGGAVRKQQSAPAFQFKGSGWYITDYAKKDSPAAKGDAAAKSADADAKSAEAKKEPGAKPADASASSPAAAAPAKSDKP